MENRRQQSVENNGPAGFVVSRNAKTGISVNVSECVPTPWCAAHCYGRRRRGTAEGSANNGPITWDRAQAAYRRNTAIIRSCAASGTLDELAIEIISQIDTFRHQSGNAATKLQLRGNGFGDLFPELCWLYALIASKGEKIFMFSRRPDMIRLLASACDELGLPRNGRPWVIGSVDPSTSVSTSIDLVDATRNINGVSRIAIATETAPHDLMRLEPLIAGLEGAVAVTFGYHTNHKLTGLQGTILASWECPATAGRDVICTECKQCYHPEN